MAKKYDPQLMIAGVLILVALALFMVRVGYFGQGTLAVVCPTCVLGSVEDDQIYNLEIELCLDSDSKAIDNVRLKNIIYGPDASSFPCKDEISVIDTTYGVDLQPGDCGTFSIEIDTSKSQYKVGEDYALIVHVFDEFDLVEGITNSAGDDQYYEDCVTENLEELNKPSNYCTINPENNKYRYCEGVAWRFDVTGEVPIECTTNADCEENEECKAGICQPIIPPLPNLTCTEGEKISAECYSYTKEQNVSYEYAECINSSWEYIVDDVPGECKEKFDVPFDNLMIFIIALIGIAGFIIYGRHKKWF